MTTAEPAARSRRSLPGLVDLLVIAAFVVWFYYPFFSEGYPMGDFASTVGVGAAGDDLVPNPWSFPSCDPYLMCGRPTVGFMSPFHLLMMPFDGFEPILRMKAIVVFYNVLSGLTMYWLLLWSGAGRIGATFGGMIYPVMAAHVSRTAIHGHIHLPMFWTLLPLLILGVLRLRAWDRRGVVLLGLLFALGFVRDTQRTVLTFVVLGLLLAGLAACSLAHMLWRRRLAPGPFLVLAISTGLAFGLGVTFDAFELINGFIGDPFRGGWRGSEQSYWMSKWSLTNLFTIVDRATWLGDNFEDLDAGFYESVSRYVGLSLLALCMYGALVPAALGATWRRFWFVLALFPISIWLSFGPKPIWLTASPRWQIFFESPEVTPALKLGLGAGAALLLLALVWSGARNLRHAGLSTGWRWPLSLGLVAAGVAAFLLIAPLPWVTRVAFFLRDFRNPDWFQVTIASFAVAYPAALTLGAIVRQLRSRPRVAVVVAALITLVTVLDMWWYRGGLTSDQRSLEALGEYREINEAIGVNPDNFRVLAVEPASANVDLGYAWHRKPLAWDFRTYTAPLHTQELISRIHELLRITGGNELAAVLAGIANVKYLVDDHGWLLDMRKSRSLRPRFEVERMTAYQNLAWRPWVQAYPAVGLVISEYDFSSIQVVAELAPLGYGMMRASGPPTAEQLAAAAVVYHDPGSSQPEWLPPGSLSLDDPPTPEARTFAREPTIDWSRPRHEEIRVTVDTAASAVIVVSESYHPWWRLWVNGDERPLEPLQHAFLGAIVAPGTSEIVLRFRRPWTYYALGWLSLASVAAALVYLWTSRRSSDGAGTATLV